MRRWRSPQPGPDACPISVTDASRCELAPLPQTPLAIMPSHHDGTVPLNWEPKTLLPHTALARYFIRVASRVANAVNNLMLLQILPSFLPLFHSLLLLVVEDCYIAQVVLELIIPLPQLPEC